MSPSRIMTRYALGRCPPSSLMWPSRPDQRSGLGAYLRSMISARRPPTRLRNRGRGSLKVELDLSHDRGGKLPLKREEPQFDPNTGLVFLENVDVTVGAAYRLRQHVDPSRNGLRPYGSAIDSGLLGPVLSVMSHRGLHNVLAPARHKRVDGEAIGGPPDLGPCRLRDSAGPICPPAGSGH